jgi:hypothetical protein
MRNITTTDLAEFGYREIEMTKDLLDLWINEGLPEEFYEDEVTVMFNKQSGKVFLTNSDFQVAMINNNELEMFYSLPYSGEEGFAEDFKEMYEDDPEYYHPEDLEFLREKDII